MAELPILALPREILEEVFSSLSSHDDLLSLALTCRTLASQIIPFHTDYRVLRVRTLNPTIFAHLARRTDLSRNIREVHICERNNYTSADRIPKALVDKKQDVDPRINGTYDERVKVWNVIRALRGMWDLRVFTWSWNVGDVGGVPGSGQVQSGSASSGASVTQGGAGRLMRPTGDPRFEEAILAEVVKKPTLKHFGIGGAFAMHVSGLPLDRSAAHPVWYLSNLTSLCLLGDAWLKASNAFPLCLMLSRSANLEYLEIPLEFKHLDSLQFPFLKYVKLHMQSGATTSVDSTSAIFLEKNPAIEELSWFPIGVPTLKPGSLPNLKHLKGNLGVIRALTREWEENAAGSVLQLSEKLPMIEEEEEPEEVDIASQGEKGQGQGQGEVASSTEYPFPLSTQWSPPSSPSTSANSYPSRAFYGNSPPASPLEPLSVPPTTPTTSLYSHGHTPYSFSSSMSAPPSRPRRQIESLDISGLTPTQLLSLPFLDPSALRKVAIHRLNGQEDVDNLSVVAERFYRLEWLMLPVSVRSGSTPSTASTSGAASNGSLSDGLSTTRGDSQYLSLPTLLELLPSFPSLKTFRGRALWNAVINETRESQDVGTGERSTAGSSQIARAQQHPDERAKTKMHQVLGELFRLCPNLEETDHCDFYEKRWAYKRVVVHRSLEMVNTAEGKESGQEEWEEVQVVGYEVKKPFMRDCFDVLDGAFN